MENLTEKEKEQLTELLDKYIDYLEENDPDAFSSIAAAQQVKDEI